jgi:hypothetical protein
VTNRIARWLTPLLGLVLAVLFAGVELARGASPAEAAVVALIIAGYAIGLVVLRRRSDTAGLLAGAAVDERWESINLKAQAGAAQVIAFVLIAAFVVAGLTGSDPWPYAWPAALLGAVYIAGILWYRWRS